MKFKYYDSDYCSLELEASNRADKELLQAMYLKLIKNPKEVSNILEKCIDGNVEWLRDNTVWEQMPSSKRTVTKIFK